MMELHPFPIWAWALLCLFLTALPWMFVLIIVGVPRFNIAHIGLLMAVIGFGLAAPRLRLNAFYSLFAVLVGSMAIAVHVLVNRDKQR